MGQWDDDDPTSIAQGFARARRHREFKGWPVPQKSSEAPLLTSLTFTSDPPTITFSIDDSGTISRNGRPIDEMSREELLETLRDTLAASGLRKADNA